MGRARHRDLVLGGQLGGRLLVEGGDLARHRDQLTCRRLVLTYLSASALASDLSGWQVAHDGWSLDL